MSKTTPVVFAMANVGIQLQLRKELLAYPASDPLRRNGTVLGLGSI
jgi:hypothetical protein